jgi:hypothetical protein
MATWQIFNSFKEAANEKVHNLGSDTIKVALSNVAPVLTNTVLANITQIAATGGYAAGTLAGVLSSQTGGTYTFAFGTDETWTAVGAAFATFRYLVAYNDTATNDELIGYLDYGVAVDVADGQSFTLVAGTIFTLASA